MRSRPAAVLSVGVLLLAGCAGPGQGYTSSSTSGLTVLTATEFVDEPGEPVSGTVATDDAGCLGLERDGEFELVVWPAGSGLTSDGRLMLPELRNTTVGRQVAGTGAPVPASDLGEAAAGCPTDQTEVVVIDAIDTVWGVH